jgi:hypothetical protein
MVTAITDTLHPRDPQYQLKRSSLVNEYLRTMTPLEIEQNLIHMASQPVTREKRTEQQELTKNVLGDILSTGIGGELVRKSILDSTGGGTSGGSVLVRQDLEAPLYALYVQNFPAWQRIRHAQSNGLVHAYNQMTAPDGQSLGSSIITELGGVSYQQTTFARQTSNIAVFATGRGVSFKEQAAVSAGGANYNPLATELANGMTVLARDVQYTMFAQSSSYASGLTTNEGGNYNTNAFDGLRVILGSVSGSNYSGNSALQVDVGTMTITEGLQFGASKAANNGGHPDLVLLSMNAKQALDTENQQNRRYNDEKREIIPGVRTNALTAADGDLDILPVPGTTIGTYTRSSDSATVEDIYFLDSRTVTLRWLYADNFTVLEIPSGVDSQLSSRYIVFIMMGLEVAAPLFNGKVRRVAS